MGRTSNTEQRRAQIVRGLIAVMAKHGYAGASVADVARKVGLAPGLVHYHFSSKLEILVEAVRTIAAEHEAALDAASAVCESPGEELVAFVDVHLGLGAHANPAALACWVDAVAESLRERRVRDEVEAALERLVERVGDILRRGREARAFALEASEVNAAAAAIVALVQGYFSVAATAREVIPSGSAAASALRMVEGLVGATLPKPSTKRHGRARREGERR